MPTADSSTRVELTANMRAFHGSPGHPYRQDGKRVDARHQAAQPVLKETRRRAWTLRATRPIDGNLDSLRWLAHRRGLLSAGDLRLGARLLRPERLCRRTASPARLAGLADLVRHHLLLSVRRGAGGLRRRSDQGVRAAQLPDRRHLRDGGRPASRSVRCASPGSFISPMPCSPSAGPARASA